MLFTTLLVLQWLKMLGATGWVQWLSSVKSEWVENVGCNLNKLGTLVVESKSGLNMLGAMVVESYISPIFICIVFKILRLYYKSIFNSFSQAKLASSLSSISM